MNSTASQCLPPSGPCSGAPTEALRLACERRGGELLLRASGQAPAEELLTLLTGALASAGRAGSLCLDVSGLRGLDNLCVSVLVVELRSHRERFDRMTICGLPGWAVRRLRSRGARELLGPSWCHQERGGAGLVFTRGRRQGPGAAN